MSTIADRLNEALAQSGMTASELARAIRVKPQAVSQWLSGATKSPNATNLLKAAVVLGVNPQWLTEGKGQRLVEARIVEPLALSAPNVAEPPIPGLDWSDLSPQARALIEVVVKRTSSGELTDEDIALLLSAVNRLGSRV